jgi:hypothetical protein
MTSLYITIAILILMIAYAGVENTLRLFAYIDLQLKFLPLRLKLKLMKIRMKRQLDIDRKELLKRIDKDAKNR